MLRLYLGYLNNTAKITDTSVCVMSTKILFIKYCLISFRRINQCQIIVTSFKKMFCEAEHTMTFYMALLIIYNRIVSFNCAWTRLLALHLVEKRFEHYRNTRLIHLIYWKIKRLHFLYQIRNNILANTMKWIRRTWLPQKGTTGWELWDRRKRKYAMTV